MAFEDRFEKIIKEKGLPKAEVARRIGLSISTFNYKSKRLTAWNVMEFNKMIEVLNLTDEEVDFLTAEVV